jgi:hypothetical protein
MTETLLTRAGEVAVDVGTARPPATTTTTGITTTGIIGVRDRRGAHTAGRFVGGNRTCSYRQPRSGHESNLLDRHCLQLACSYKKYPVSTKHARERF